MFRPGREIRDFCAAPTGAPPHPRAPRPRLPARTLLAALLASQIIVIGPAPTASRPRASDGGRGQIREAQTKYPARSRGAGRRPAPPSRGAGPGAAGSEGGGQPGAAGQGGSRDAPAQEVGQDEVVRVDSNLVIIPATVLDGQGRAVTDLKLEDFELRVDGEAQPIGDLSRAETPVQIVLLFDNSASLSAARGLEKQAAVRFFRSVVRPVDRAAVYSVSTSPALAQPLTNDVARLVSTVERFGAPDGATALFDALAEAADYMRAVAGRKVLVVVSDGADTVSDATFEEAFDRAQRADCQVYVVQTRQFGEPGPRDFVADERMRKLSEQTGGAVFSPRSLADLDAAFTQIALDLSRQYLLSYYPRSELGGGRFRSISIGVRARPALRVRARKGFYPPGGAAAK